MLPIFHRTAILFLLLIRQMFFCLTLGAYHLRILFWRLRRGFENRKRRCTFLFVYEAILMFVDGEIAYK